MFVFKTYTEYFEIGFQTKRITLHNYNVIMLEIYDINGKRHTTLIETVTRIFKDNQRGRLEASVFYNFHNI